MCGEIVVVPKDDAPVAGKLPVPIETARLRLRPPIAADAPAVVKFMADPEIYRYWDAQPMDEAEVEAAIADRWTNRLTQAPGTVWFGVELAGTVIGLAWFGYVSQERQQGSLFAVIHPEFQRRGFGTEAVGALLAFGFSGIGLHRVAASCDSRNAAACRVFEKSGLRREGEFVQDRLVRGEWVNTVQYALLADEFDRARR